MKAGIAFAFLILAACDPIGGEGILGDPPPNRMGGNVATPTPPPVESPLAGRWADNPQSCAQAVEIFGNGTVRAGDGSRGHWRLEGNRLTFNLGQRVFVFTLVSVERDRIALIDNQGQRSESVRCP